LTPVASLTSSTNGGEGLLSTTGVSDSTSDTNMDCGLNSSASGGRCKALIVGAPDDVKGTFDDVVTARRTPGASSTVNVLPPNAQSSDVDVCLDVDMKDDELTRAP